MRTLAIYDGDYPWDIRVEKLLKTFRSAGHEVMLMARNQQRRPAEEVLDGVQIRRLRAVTRWETLASFPAFFHPRWAALGLRCLREFQPDRIVVRDLPLAPLGHWLSQRSGSPLIVDMAEPYPLALRSNWEFDNYLSGINYLTHSPRFAEWTERWLIRQQPRILVVCEEAGERLEKLGLAREHWTLVRNTPERDKMLAASQANNPSAELSHLEDRFKLIFTGILMGDRGIEVVLEGLAQLPRETRDEPALIVVGDGPARAGWELRAEELGVEAHFLGWRDHADLPGFLLTADLGILPFHSCPHIETTLANKLFDYMCVGLPVLASSVRPMQRVLDETRAGITFQAGDPRDFALALDSLLADRERLQTLGANGRVSVEETYNWEQDAQRLLEAVERA